jgi:hypothetical protein
MEGQGAELQLGATVIGSDGAPVGVISEVREDVIVVEHVNIVRHQLFIPTHSLAVTNDGSVALNVPARAVDSQGWLRSATP